MGVGGRSLTAPERDSPGPPPVRGGGLRSRSLAARACAPRSWCPLRSARRGRLVSLPLRPPPRSGLLACLGLVVPAPSLGLASGPRLASGDKPPPAGRRGTLLPALPLYQPVKGKGPPAPATVRPGSFSGGPLRRPQGASPWPRGPQETPCAPPLTRLIPWETARKEANQDVKNL